MVKVLTANPQNLHALAHALRALKSGTWDYFCPFKTGTLQNNVANFSIGDTIRSEHRSNTADLIWSGPGS